MLNRIRATPWSLSAQVAYGLVLFPIIIAFFLGGILLSLTVDDREVEEGLAPYIQVLDTHAIIGINGLRTTGGWSECRGMSFGLGDREYPSLLDEALRGPTIGNCDPLGPHVRGEERQEGSDYARFWHGYAVVSRPVIAHYGYGQLMMVSFWGFFVLLILLLWQLSSRFGSGSGAALLIPLIIVNTAGVFTYWTKAVTWLVALGASVVLLRLLDRKPDLVPALPFFVVGALTSYVDFLQTPLVTFTLPAVALLLHGLRSGVLGSVSRQFRTLLVVSVSWIVGYAGAWTAKWILALVLVEGFALSSVFDTIAFRLSGEYASATPGIGRAIAAVVGELGTRQLVMGVVAYVVPLMVPRVRRHLAMAVRNAPAFLALAVLPILWIEILSNHSQVHSHFAQVNLVIPLLALGVLMYSNLLPISPDLDG